MIFQRVLQRTMTGVFGLLLIGSFSGCVANRQHRVKSTDQSHPRYSLAFVEMDDQGELWDPSQLANATQLIDHANKNPRGALVVLFIHGWNHNASFDDDLEHGNIVGFRHILEQIALQDRQDSGASPRPVIGIYMAWRGKLFEPKWLRPLSFFNRRGAALRVSGPASTEVVYRVATTAKMNPATKVALIGHSFGGLVLERAVTQAMIGGVLDFRNEQDRAFPADVVILLNPASQAIYAKQFIDALKRERVRLFRKTPAGNRFERPLIVSVTSNADTATGFAFPAGLTFRSMGKSFRRYADERCVPLGRQKVFYKRTAGHSPVLISHEVTSSAVPSAFAASRNSPEPSDGLFGSVQTRLDPVTREPTFTFQGDGRQFQISRRPKAFNDSPYWILTVDRTLIPNHAQVFGNNTVSLLGALMAISGALEQGTSTELTRNAGIAPVELAVRADNVPMVLDRDRRVFVLNDKEELLPLGCIPPEVDAADRIGLDFGPLGGVAITNTRVDGKHRGYRTKVLDIQLSEQGPTISRRRQLDTNRRFVAAVTSFSDKRVFLASDEGGEIWWADLENPKAPLTLAATLPDSGPLIAMALDDVGKRLFLSDGVRPRIFSLSTGDFSSTIAVGNAGSPVGLAFDSKREFLYSLDAEGQEIWRRTCRPAMSCQAPTKIGLGGLIEEPTFLRVGGDGILWVAGLFENRVLGRRLDGTVFEVHTVSRASF